jgi:hypothetical protein
MGANEVLRFIEMAAALIAACLGILTAILAYKYRVEIKRAEKRRAVRKLRPHLPAHRSHAHSETQENERELASMTG